MDKVKEPVRVKHVQDGHHALNLWEEICDSGEDGANLPPLLLVPEGYTFLEGKEGMLNEMARAYKVNELVSVALIPKKGCGLAFLAMSESPVTACIFQLMHGCFDAAWDANWRARVRLHHSQRQGRLPDQPHLDDVCR